MGRSVVYGFATGLLHRAANARRLAAATVDAKRKAALIQYAEGLEAEVKSIINPPSAKPQQITNHLPPISTPPSPNPWRKS